jgi:hypothetical protein
MGKPSATMAAAVAAAFVAAAERTTTAPRRLLLLLVGLSAMTGRKMRGQGLLASCCWRIGVVDDEARRG